MTINLKLVLMLSFLGMVYTLNAQLSPQENEKGKFGFVDDGGEWVIKAQWDEAGNFSNGIAWVKKGNLYGYIDEAGKYIVKPKYTSVGTYDDFNLCKISVGGSYDKAGILNGAKYGFIDRNTREIVKPKYSYISRFDKNGRCWVNIGGKINKKTGNLVGGKYGYLLDSGVELTKIEYDDIRNQFSASGFAWVRKGKKYGYIDTKGRRITDVKYDAVQDTFYNEMAAIKIKNLYGYISSTGKETAIKYIYTGNFENGLGLVVVNPKKGLPKFGYINKNGKEVIEPVYDDAHEAFSEGFSAVKKDDKWAIINSQGKLITGFKYNLAKEFKNGLAPVSLTGVNPMGYEFNHFALWGLVNEEGQLIVPCKYEFVEAPCENGLRMVKTKSQPTDMEREMFTKIGRSASQKEIEEITGKVMTGEYGKIKLEEIKEINTVQIRKKTNSWIGEKYNLYFNAYASHGFSNYRTAKIYSAIGNGKIKEYLRLQQIELQIASNIAKSSEVASTDKSGIGWVNSQGEEVIPLIYQDAIDFNNGLAMVKRDSINSGFIWINAQNEVVLQTNYRLATPFRNGIACVYDSDTEMWGGINLQGEVMIPFLLSNKRSALELSNESNEKQGKPFTRREVTLFNLYKHREQDKFNIRDIIPDNMWDF